VMEPLLTEGVNVTEQAPEDKVHVVDEKEPCPVGLAVKVMVPVAARVAPPPLDTVAVQVDGEFGLSGLGEQTTEVVVVILVTVKVTPAEGPLLVWSVSPA